MPLIRPQLATLQILLGVQNFTPHKSSFSMRDWGPFLLALVLLGVRRMSLPPGVSFRRNSGCVSVRGRQTDRAVYAVTSVVDALSVAA